jgi:hypothetical protein
MVMVKETFLELLDLMAADEKERPRASRIFMLALLWRLPPADRANAMEFLLQYGRQRLS